MGSNTNSRFWGVEREGLLVVNMKNPRFFFENLKFSIVFFQKLGIEKGIYILIRYWEVLSVRLSVRAL